MNETFKSLKHYKRYQTPGYLNGCQRIEWCCTPAPLSQCANVKATSQKEYKLNNVRCLRVRRNFGPELVFYTDP